MSKIAEQIKQYCEHQGWYGPENKSPSFLRVSASALERSAFLYPPATEEQISETIKRIGLPLPSVLQTIYRELANGGFGPGYGLHGFVGGHDPIPEHYPNHIHFVELPTDWSDATQVFEFSWSEWPEKLLTIADEGCGIYWCTDCRIIEAPVFRVIPSEFCWQTRRVAPSLEQWLEAWLKEENNQQSA